MSDRSTSSHGLLVWLPRAVIVLASAATIVGLILVERLGDRYRAALDIATEAADIAAEAADSVVSFPADVAEVTDAVAEITGRRARRREHRRGFDARHLRGSTDQPRRFGERHGGRGESRASLIESIERFIPGDVESLGEELRTIADGLEPVPAELVDLGDQLADGAADLDEAAATLETLEGRLQTVSGSIAAATSAIQRVPDVAEELRDEANRTRDRVDADLWFMRLGVLFTGLTVVGIGFALEPLRRRCRRPLSRRTRRADAGLIVRRYACPRCAATLFFNDDRCLTCGAQAVYDHGSDWMLEADGTSVFRCAAAFTDERCNWLALPNGLCMSCSLDLPDSVGASALRRPFQEAKRRTLRQLAQFGIDPATTPLALRFRLLHGTTVAPVTIGHAGEA